MEAEEDEERAAYAPSAALLSEAASSLVGEVGMIENLN